MPQIEKYTVRILLPIHYFDRPTFPSTDFLLLCPAPHIFQFGELFIWIKTPVHSSVHTKLSSCHVCILTMFLFWTSARHWVNATRPVLAFGSHSCWLFSTIPFASFLERSLQPQSAREVLSEETLHTHSWTTDLLLFSSSSATHSHHFLDTQGVRCYQVDFLLTLILLNRSCRVSTSEPRLCQSKFISTRFQETRISLQIILPVFTGSAHLVLFIFILWETQAF